MTSITINDDLQSQKARRALETTSNKLVAAQQELENADAALSDARLAAAMGSKNSQDVGRWSMRRSEVQREVDELGATERALTIALEDFDSRGRARRGAESRLAARNLVKEARAIEDELAQAILAASKIAIKLRTIGKSFDTAMRTAGACGVLVDLDWRRDRPRDPVGLKASFVDPAHAALEIRHWRGEAVQLPPANPLLAQVEPPVPGRLINAYDQPLAEQFPESPYRKPNAA